MFNRTLLGIGIRLSWFIVKYTDKNLIALYTLYVSGFPHSTHNYSGPPIIGILRVFFSISVILFINFLFW